MRNQMTPLATSVPNWLPDKSNLEAKHGCILVLSYSILSTGLRADGQFSSRAVVKFQEKLEPKVVTSEHQSKT
jgi:hypothetical protein